MSFFRHVVPLAAALSIVSHVSGQSLIHVEGFETDGNSTTYRANEFDDSSSDVWTRSGSATGPNSNTSHSYSNYVGNTWWCGEDIDATDNPFGSGGSGYIMIKTLDVSTSQGDTITVKAFLAGNTGDIKRYEADDYLKLKYAFDSDIATGANTLNAVPDQSNLATGTYTTFGAFYGTGTSSLDASALIHDSDLDGSNDGTIADSLTNSFAEWSFQIPVGSSDSLVSILFEAKTSAGSEEIGIDQVQVYHGVVPACQFSATITSQTNIDCNDNGAGALSVNESGGTGPFSYTWSSGDSTHNSSLSTDSVGGLIAGTYTVTVVDAEGCLAIAEAVLTQSNSSISVSTIVDSSITCNGFSDGGGSVTVSGGTGGLFFSWSTGAVTSSVTGIPAGLYVVTVSDANYCSDTAHLIVPEPDELNAQVVVDSNASCFGANNGGLTAGPLTTGYTNGGTLPYQYVWSTGDTTSYLTGIVAGLYSATVTDANGCADSSSNYVLEPDPLLASITINTPVNCSTNTGGQITASATGGWSSSTRFYLWSTGATTATISGLSSGLYTVTVADWDCQDTVTIFLGMSVAVSPQANVSCFGLSDGTAHTDIMGGTAPFTYSWSTSDTTDSITSLSAGTYSVTVTDATGCSDSTSTVITQPDLLVVSAAQDSMITCFGFANGQVSATSTGGTANYAYSWSNAIADASNESLTAGSYSVTVTDANGCTDSTAISLTQPATLIATSSVNSSVSCFGLADGAATASASGGTSGYGYAWSTGAATATTSGLSMGTYTITITDANGCTDASEVVISQPAALIAAASVDSNASCFGSADGVITVSASGGTAAYTYNWSNGETTVTNSGLTAALYSITVTDANGCTDTASASVSEPTVLMASATADSNVTCFGFNDGGGSASAVGGTTSYAFQWSNGTSTGVNDNLTAGIYTVTVTDANGCTDTASISISEPSELIASASLGTNVSCFGLSDGLATASAVGGVSGYTYVWSNGATTTNNSGLTSGTYSITITDASGCTDSASILISQPSDLVAIASVDSTVSCFGFNNGGASVIATGGTAGFTYTWSSSETTASISGLSASIYSVTVTDANGCTDSTAINISQPTEVMVTVSMDSGVSCYGSADGAASASGSGGTPGYTYAWSNTETTMSIQGLTAATYTVTLADANGCTDVGVIVMNQPAEMTASIINVDPETCPGYENGSAEGIATGGLGMYTYLWSNGDTTAITQNLSAGGYGLSVSDLNGCTATDSVIVLLLSTGPNLDFGSDTVFLAQNENLCAPGAFDSYAWSTGSTDSCIITPSAGQYSLTVADSFGCVASDTVFAQLTLGQAEVENGTEITIYPNPATDLITVELQENQDPTSLTLIDMQGRIVLSRPYVRVLHIKHLDRGAYFLQIWDGSSRITQKVILN